MATYTYPHGNVGVDCETTEGQAEIARYEAILERMLNEAYPGENWAVRGEHSEGSHNQDDALQYISQAAWAEYVRS